MSFTDTHFLGNPREIRLIDVLDHGVFPAPERASYVALSCVWDGNQQLILEKATANVLGRKGSLSTHVGNFVVSPLAPTPRRQNVSVACGICQDEASHGSRSRSTMTGTGVARGATCRLEQQVDGCQGYRAQWDSLAWRRNVLGEWETCPPLPNSIRPIMSGQWPPVRVDSRHEL
jgi:hypothetical protein